MGDASLQSRKNTIDRAVLHSVQAGATKFVMIWVQVGNQCPHLRLGMREVDLSLQRLKHAGRLEYVRGKGWTVREEE